MGLIRTLFIILIIYYGFQLFMKYVVPFLLARFVRKTQERMANHQDENIKQSKKKEGEINVDFVPGKKTSPKKSELGDYVDYEDVNE